MQIEYRLEKDQSGFIYPQVRVKRFMFFSSWKYIQRKEDEFYLTSYKEKYFLYEDDAISFTENFNHYYTGEYKKISKYLVVTL